MSHHYLTSSEQQPQHCTRSTSESEKAWHILSILSTLRLPARPEELASRCQLFDATADLVLSLCSIPNSPICLTETGLVTASMAAVSALEEFVSKPMRLMESNQLCDCNVKTYFRKRKRAVLDDVAVSMAKRRLFYPIENGEADVTLVSRLNCSQHNLLEGKSNSERALVPLLVDSNAGFSCSHLTHFEHGEVDADILMHKERPGFVDTSNLHHSLLKALRDSCTMKPIQVDSSKACLPDLNLPPPSSDRHRQSGQEALAGNGRLKNETADTATIYLEEDKQNNMDAAIHDTHSFKASLDQLKKDSQTPVENSVKEGFIEFGAEEDSESLLSENLAAFCEALTHYIFSISSGNTVNIVTLEKDQNMKKAETKTDPLLAECPSTLQQLENSSCKLKGMCKNLPSQEPQQVLVESLEYNEVVNSPEQQNQYQCKRGQNFPSIEHKLKNSTKNNTHGKENMVDTTSISPKVERIKLPHFDDFIIEEKEGSGGYGIVYRAQRKNDGKRFAIKCPHGKAHKHHVDNELKMLERFGGRNFIIKYEGSCRSGDSECFILEHVEHERPEVLKREIDLFELQWYGYCMFRALACLHKQGVVHRDVKPGNFLFSRKLNKGYLIDFNLAMDLQKKYAVGSKSKSSHHVSFGHVPPPPPQSKSALLKKEKKFMRGDLVDMNLGATVDTKQTHDPNKNVRKRALLKNYPDMGGGNIFKSQGVDGSGITYTKDVTSTRTPSTERVREPLPCQGRKELISLVHDAILSPNHDAIKTPASQRKRIAATPGKIDRKIIHTSPMSLHFTGVADSGARLLKSKGDGRQEKEGPCVGTKGFRAPEVLFRSLHQGPKVDVWSAGVTLLYLMMGRTPFTGDPEQNIKDIAKLKGSEDLWEVAKLHDRESSFPKELLDIQCLSSMELRSWCKAHTMRPQFFRLIPRSLFDLVDKCLTVNPRLRISAEEALRHEFFASCHESLRKQRMFRHELMSAQNDLVHEESRV